MSGKEPILSRKEPLMSRKEPRMSGRDLKVMLVAKLSQNLDGRCHQSSRIERSL